MFSLSSLLILLISLLTLGSGPLEKNFKFVQTIKQFNEISLVSKHLAQGLQLKMSQLSDTGTFTEILGNVHRPNK